jgi:hypothetical protein
MTWHVTGRLTLTYGVRWDLNPPPRDRDPNNGNYTPLVGNFADPSTLHPGTPGSALWNTQYKNLTCLFWALPSPLFALREARPERRFAAQLDQDGARRSVARPGGNGNA